ncbi:hypothetical protein ACFWPU_46425 [Streptomyces sp. NPDC058471]|uniref:hypothetical protein n=1 Tax=Streptomyces sp. NPDC058471 TaxID=3346516 RepID=UPI00365DB332
MPYFQTGEVPHGFAFDENGGVIHYKHTIILAVPAANQGTRWGDLFLSFGTAFADAKLGVSVHDGNKWSGIEPWDIPDAGGRVAKKLPTGSQKIAIGRWKKSAGDSVDDNPVSWLIEYL